MIAAADSPTQRNRLERRITGLAGGLAWSSKCRFAGNAALPPGSALWCADFNVARIAEQRTPSLVLERRQFSQNVGSPRPVAHAVILSNRTVPKHNDALGELGNIMFVGDHDDGKTAFI